MVPETNQSQKDKYCMIPYTWDILNSQNHKVKEWSSDCQGLRTGK